MGVMDLFHESIAQSLFGPRSLSNPLQSQLKFSPSSRFLIDLSFSKNTIPFRTDSGVHALRSSVILQVPLTEGILDDSVEKKASFLSQWNSISDLACPHGLHFRFVLIFMELMTHLFKSFQ